MAPTAARIGLTLRNEANGNAGAKGMGPEAGRSKKPGGSALGYKVSTNLPRRIPTRATTSRTLDLVDATRKAVDVIPSDEELEPSVASPDRPRRRRWPRLGTPRTNPRARQKPFDGARPSTVHAHPASSAPTTTAAESNRAPRHALPARTRGAASVATPRDSRPTARNNATTTTMMSTTIP